MTKKDLKRLVEEKVNEAWYNNSDDFFKGVGKVTTAGILGTAGLAGGAYCLDQGLQQQERYEQQLNQEAAKNMYGSDYHYEKWCNDHGLDPKDNNSHESYEEWVEEELNETKIRNMVRRAIVENIVRQKLSEAMGWDSHYSIDRDDYCLDNGYCYDGDCGDDGCEYEQAIERIENGTYDSELDDIEINFDQYYPNAESYGAKDDMLQAINDRRNIIKAYY